MGSPGQLEKVADGEEVPKQLFSAESREGDQGSTAGH